MRKSFLAFILLSGCSLAPGGAQYEAAIDAGTDSAIKDVQHFDDRVAHVYPKGLCAITLGGYARMEEGQVKQGIALICGLAPTTTVLSAPAPPVAGTASAPVQ